MTIRTCLIVIAIILFSFTIVEIIERTRTDQPTISEHTNYCYEMCRRMVNDEDSFYFEMEYGWTHCVNDCGGYD